MRNWNSQVYSPGTGKKLVFTVPMRNWNHYIWRYLRAISTSFYSTYEELKHSRRNNQGKGFLGFYSTYEELKPGPFLICNSSLLKFLQYLWGIETSVEDTPNYTANNGFLQYLWGIETERRSPMRERLHSVFTVPMRNWNIRFFLQVQTVDRRFYSTYEELKLLNSFSRKRPLLGFYSTYEELKPDIWRFNKWYRVGFYSTYEELKPDIGCLCITHAIMFLQYLWGIET